MHRTACAGTSGALIEQKWAHATSDKVCEEQREEFVINFSWPLVPEIPVLPLRVDFSTPSMATRAGYSRAG